MLLISSGFDAARHDPLGQCTVTPNGFFYMTKQINELSFPSLVVLEGGYNMVQTALGATAVLKGLLSEKKLPEPIEKLKIE